MWNGWCTKRRFQQYGTCCLGCDAFWQEDSIEHYACCSVATGFARNFLRIRPVHFHVGHLVALGLTDKGCSEEDILMHALWAYALYKAHNLLRYNPLAPGEDPTEILKQFAREGVRGNSFAITCLDGRWAY